VLRRPAWLLKASLLITGSAKDAAPVFARLREVDPVCWIPRYDAWLVTRHDDVQALFVDPRVTTDPRVYERYVAPSSPGAMRWVAALPFRATNLDPQSVSRRLALGVLTPRIVERMGLGIREIVERFAAPLRQRRDTVDLMAEFTAPVSATAIGRILGVPPKESDESRFRVLACNATRGIRPIVSESKRKKSESAIVEICEYVLQLVEQRRREPAEDIITELLKVSAASTQDEIDNVVRIVSALVSAGTGTTGVACARGLRTLLLHPGELARLRNDRSLLPNAVEELLRYDSGLALVPRYVVDDFELRGRRLKKGQLVALSVLGANRDPSVFEEPDRLDFGRNCRQALSFGHGPHYCTGTSIARVELLAMFEAALDFLPEGARLLENQIRWSSRGLMGQMRSLPVDFRG